MQPDIGREEGLEAISACEQLDCRCLESGLLQISENALTSRRDALESLLLGQVQLSGIWRLHEHVSSASTTKRRFLFVRRSYDGAGRSSDCSAKGREPDAGKRRV